MRAHQLGELLVVPQPREDDDTLGMLLDAAMERVDEAQARTNAALERVEALAAVRERLRSG